MYIHFSRRSWVILLRRPDFPSGDRAIGIMIKPVSEMLFSERYRGYKHAFKIGKLYFRTFKRQPIVHRPADYVYAPLPESVERMKELQDETTKRLNMIWYAGLTIDQDSNVTYLRRNPATGNLEPGPCPWPTAPSADDRSS